MACSLRSVFCATRAWLALYSLLCIAACEREARPAAQTLQTRAAAATDPQRTRPSGTSEARAPLVVFLGDSLAAGLDLPADQAFPAVLEASLRASTTPFRLANAGVSGDTSAGGLRRLDWLLKQKPKVVVIELGANDGMRGHPLDALASNLRAIVARVRAASAVPLLLGMRVPTSLGAPYSEAFAALYPALAKELDVAFVPELLAGVGGVPELNLADGIHPTAEGHRRLADNVRPALIRLLAAAP
ncbi:MAG: arylesterase [Polyangiales bacterium]